ITDRLSSFAVPDDRSLSLVGYSYSGNLVALYSSFRDCIFDTVDLCLKNLFCVVFYPTRLGKVLLEFFLRRAYGFVFAVESDGSAAGGSLVDCNYETAHGWTL